MRIKACFPYYKQERAYELFCNLFADYKGEHDFIIAKGQGTIVHDVRNTLVTESIRINKINPELSEFDATLWIDEDIEFTKEDVLHLISLDKDIAGLPYQLRGSDKYNAGHLTKKGYIHLPKRTKGLKPVDGQGMGFRFIKRKVFEKIPPFWFWPDIMEIDGQIETIVEDWSFDAKARKAGFVSWCDFNHPVNHNLGEAPMSQVNSYDRVGRVNQGKLAEVSNDINQLINVIDKQNILIAEQNEEIKKLKAAPPIKKISARKKQ